MLKDARSARGKRIRTACAVALTLAVTATAGCSGESSADDDTVTIGLISSLSGVYKPVGTETRDGFKLYLDTHDGKLGGRKIDLKIADEGDGPPTALPAAKKLIKKDRVDVLTGVTGGGSVKAMLPLVTRNKIPLVGSNARPPVKDGEYVWHTSFMSDEPGAAIAQHVKDEVDGPVYAIGPDYQGGHDEMRGFTTAFDKVGGELANPDGKTTWTPFPKTTNFAPYFAKIARTGAKAVYCFYAGKAAIDFVKQYAESDVADLPLYSAGFITEGSVLPAQGKTAKGIYSVLNYSADLDNEANRKFVSDWTAKHDEPPTSYAEASYDAAATLDKAIGEAAKKGEVNSETINKAIAGLGKIDSPRGTWEYSEKTHTPVQQWYLRQVRPDGKQLANVVVKDLSTLGS
ncbi:amino acid/amide ABC transporter substrate-binding protein, HAAT family [Streptomyces sp. WMMB 714]|jgi:branched-chain amino acid transport system substrate-binding protein|uniref:ABC transporter substrate-binding protein n=1 Tax=Streptomyces sp. WMMB 714 TaxID=1286822 RepID=UPI0005F7FEF5|nr:ABC transporter substrate-binding protein [Streptomyces sp. WMMB 714]SCK58393.1 amino acid/amide ABC transporter substrate-binding protein, HAAT family [Streptomyces sp. WMMB 714]